MTKVFLRHDMAGITISPEHGGCGQNHQGDDEHAVDCPTCGPILVRDHGAGFIPSEAELTPDEQRQADRLKEEGTVATQQMANALGKMAAEQVSKVNAPKRAKKPAPKKAKARA